MGVFEMLDSVRVRKNLDPVQRCAMKEAMRRNEMKGINCELLVWI
jgi:hypothetical protein